MSQAIHVLLVDYDLERRARVERQIHQRFADRPATMHYARSRSEALGHLWEMASSGVVPRAIVSSWLLDEPGAREFYSLIGREVDHTSLSLLRNALKIDRANADCRTILLCYAENEEQHAEALLEVQSEVEMRDRVAVVTYDQSEPQTFGRLTDMLYNDERTRIYQLSAMEEQILVEATVESEDPSGSSPLAEGTTSGLRRALRRLSR